MRVKTDAKRQAIVAAAWEVFKKNGFERTTMSDISAQVGGSKATLYGYFDSKEQLFAAALEHIIQDQADQAFEGLMRPGDLKVRLADLAKGYLQARLTPEMVAVERALITEGERTDLGETMRMRFIQPHWRKLAGVLDQEMEAGRLRKADPMLATWHFRGMIEADLVERRLHGDATITAHEVERAITEGVSAFLRAYEP